MQAARAKTEPRRAKRPARLALAERGLLPNAGSAKRTPAYAQAAAPAFALTEPARSELEPTRRGPAPEPVAAQPDEFGQGQEIAPEPGGEFRDEQQADGPTQRPGGVSAAAGGGTPDRAMPERGATDARTEAATAAPEESAEATLETETEPEREAVPEGEGRVEAEGEAVQPRPEDTAGPVAEEPEPRPTLKLPPAEEAEEGAVPPEAAGGPAEAAETARAAMAEGAGAGPQGEMASEASVRAEGEAAASGARNQAALLAGGAPAEVLAAEGGAPALAAGGAAAPSVPVGPEPAGGTAEEGEAETEARLAEAAGDRQPEEDAGATPVEEEAPASDIGEADATALAPGVPEPEAEGAKETSEPGTAESSVQQAEAAADVETAEDARAETEAVADAERPPPGVPSGGELAAVGVEDAAEAPAPEAAVEQTESSGGAATEPSLELPPAERDVALAAVSEDVGGAGPPSGGGGGGSAITPPAAVAAPDVSGAEPAQALAAVGSLPPVQLQAALGGVSGAVGRSVGEKRSKLQAEPPTIARPSGSPRTRRQPIATPPAPSERDAARRPERAPEGQARPVAEPAPLPPPPAPPTEAVAEPRITGGTEGEVSADDAAALRTSLRRLPASDPALAVDVGAPPPLTLAGNADPANVEAQRGRLEQSVASAEARGRADAAQPMGENEIYPEVPEETLRATVPGGGAGAGGAAAAASGAGGPPATASGGGGGEDAALSVIASERHGAEIRGAVAAAQGEMATQRQRHAERETAAQADSERAVAAAEAASAAAQEGERGRARDAVRGLRGEWTAAQASTVQAHREEADREQARGGEEIAGERRRGEAEAASHVAEGNREAAQARRQGEAEAARERRRGEEESSGVFGWLASKAKAFFDGIKRGIKAAFERARAAVRAAIDRAKRLAVAVIERARQAIVSVIRRVGDALIAIGDRLLADFPGLRDRFRRAIQERVAAAEAAVNRFADQLKADVQRALDALGGALDAALGLLERGMLAAVDAVGSVVQGAIAAARAVAEALAAFARLIADVAASPGRWLRNLGAGIVDGIRNHLWNAFKAEVQGWFNRKLEQVLGLGTAVWNVLRQGGISLAEIGRMAWEGIKSAIPMVLIQILVEKLVAMIVPAAGAVMAIVEGLQAAWGTVSQIIRAFGLFFEFLKQVRAGNAGPQFARALAAAAVAVIDFVANWLLRRLIRPARRVGGRIRAIARRIMARLRRVGQRVGRAARRAGRRLRAGLRRVGRRLTRRRGARPRGRERRRDRREQQERRLQRATERLRPTLSRDLRGGISRLLLRAKLLALRIRYRLSSLRLLTNGQIEASINPRRVVIVSDKMSPQEIGRALEPVLARAQRIYFEMMAEERSRVGQERMRRAREQLEGGPDPRLPPLRRAEEAALLSQIEEMNLRPAERGKFTSTRVRGGAIEGAEFFINVAGGRATPANIFVSGAGRYERGTARSIIEHIERLEERHGGGETLRRLSPSRQRLLGTVEPSRGAFAAMRIGEEMAITGLARPSEVMAGELAPLAFSGATGEAPEDVAERQRRIGNLFARLRDAITREDIFQLPGGAALRRLAIHVERFLGAHLRGARPRDIDRIVRQLVISLRYFGRGL